MKKISTILMITALLFVFVGVANAEVNSVTPSTNDINKTNGWAHVDEVSVGVGEVTLNFIQPRSFYACFEYRTDGDTSQTIGANNPNTLVTDGLYPYYCENSSNSTHTLYANEYVEIRMVFGAEGDERFDWTRFDVIPDTEAPIVTNVIADPNPASVGSSVTVTANIDDTTTGGSNIASAEYNFDGGAWTMMDESDGAFDDASEDVSASFTTPSEPGIYTLCVRGTDMPGNVSNSECTMFVVYDPSGGFVTGGGWIDSQGGSTAPIFNSIPETMPGSFPSLGYEATSTDEAGDHIAFAGTDLALQSVKVGLTNWSCENDFDYVSGTWVPNRSNTDACVTTPGSGFNHPITLNIYEVDNSGPVPAVGALIASKTETFFIPFRPSWDSAMCDDPSTDVPFGGKWYDPVLGYCVHGYAFNIDFDFSADGITLPNEVIYGVAYNTSHHGNTPLGVNGPYNSLNLSLTTDAPTIGTDVETGTIFWDTSYGPFYCDGGAGGSDTFRRDADCWDSYIPVVQFVTQTEGAYKADASLTGKATFGFVAKYKKGANVPDGNTEFQFKAGNLNFHSTEYQWLVINQGGTNAQFKGYGTINGAGNYGFMIWAGDGSPDTFRIKIWYEDNGTEVVVYDNGPDQAIGGGSIVVHTKK